MPSQENTLLSPCLTLWDSVVAVAVCVSVRGCVCLCGCVGVCVCSHACTCMKKFIRLSIISKKMDFVTLTHIA